MHRDLHRMQMLHFIVGITLACVTTERTNDLPTPAFFPKSEVCEMRSKFTYQFRRRKRYYNSDRYQRLLFKSAGKGLKFSLTRSNITQSPRRQSYHAHRDHASAAHLRRNREFKAFQNRVANLINLPSRSPDGVGLHRISRETYCTPRSIGLNVTERHRREKYHSYTLKRLKTSRCLEHSTETDMFSFCNVSGLFILSNGSRTLTDADLQEPAKWQGDDTDRASYVFYDTVISCSENAPLLANLRVSSSLSESILPDGTAAFVLGDAFVRTSENVSFIDAKHLKAFNAEASSFFPPFAPFYTTHISSLGTICGETKVLEDGSNFFPVAVSVNFKNDITSFKLA